MLAARTNHPSTSNRILTEDEIGRLLAAVQLKDDMALRDLAILVLFLDTGLRLSELLSLELEDLHFDDQWLKVMGKVRRNGSRRDAGPTLTCFLLVLT